jgi:hypothetical protein
MKNAQWIHNNFVILAAQRWYDAFGPNVVKVLEDFVYSSLDHAAAGGASATVGGWTVTAVEGGAGDTVVAQMADGPGGILRITTDAAENDGANLQVVGESFDLSDEYPLYFGVRFRLVADETQCDFLSGLCITNTNLLGGMTDGIYFRKVDGATTLNFVLEKNNAETATAYGTALAADTWYTAEFLFNGEVVDWYINGVLQTRPAVTNLPDDEHLTPSIHYLTGEANANIADVDWIRAIQIQA